MFLGEYPHIIDNKNRLRLPPKYRKEMSDGMVLTRGNDGCLFIVPKSQFNDIYEKIKNLPLFDTKAQRPLRMIFSSAVEIEEDNQGRFLLPSLLKAFANIKKEVVFVGVGNRIELWAQDKWLEYQKISEQNFDQVLSNLGEYGI